MSREWQWPWEMERPTVDAREVLNEMFDRNGRTKGAVVGEMLLGKDVFVATLRRPVIIEGECWEVPDRTVDLFDLMDMHAEGR